MVQQLHCSPDWPMTLKRCDRSGSWATIVWRIALLVTALALNAWSQSSETKPQPHSAVPQAVAASNEPWSYSVTVDGYLPSTGDGLAFVTFTADHKWLHTEARYNYENLRTGSLWFGYNFSWGKTWAFEVTPMIGGVFGRTDGIAPGCEASLNWKKFTFSIDNEYVFDTTAKGGSFYYAWPQITYQPWSWLRVGGVAQRSKIFESNLDVQRGFLVGVNYKKFQFTTYVLNPGLSHSFVQFEVGATF